MSYLSINIDNLSNMISEYNNLIEALKGCGDILSQSIGSLSEFEFSGVDAEILREAWGAETYDKIPTIREVLESVKSALEDSLEEYKNCKKYNEEFIVAFDGYGDVCFSAEDMSGNVKCDTSMLSDSSSYCAEIGDIKLDIATSIVSAKNMMAGLNKSQTAISQGIEDFANLNIKLNQFSLHQFTLSKYSGMMTEADDNLYNKLNAKNFSFTSLYINDGYVPPAVKLMGYSPEVLRVATILAKGNPTKEEEEYLNWFYTSYELDDTESVFLATCIGDAEWDIYDVAFMTHIYEYGVDRDSTSVLNAVFNNMISTDAELLLDTNKAMAMMTLIDPDIDGEAYDSMSRFMKISFDNSSLDRDYSKFVFVTDEDGQLVFNYEYSWNEYRDKGSYSNEFLFVNIDEEISEDGKNNLLSMGFTKEDYSRFRTSFYTDEDIVFLKNLSEANINDNDSLMNFFAQDVKGVSQYTNQALVEYTLHFGQYGSEGYIENMCNFLDAMYAGGMNTFYELDYSDIVDDGGIGRSNVDCYLDKLAYGYEARFDEQLIVTAEDFTRDNYDEYNKYDVLTTFFASQREMYNNCISSHYPLFDFTSAYDDRFEIHISMNSVGVEQMTYHFEYKIGEELTYVEYNNDLEITVYSDANGMIGENGKGHDEIASCSWQKDHYYQKIVYETAKVAAFVYNPYSACVIGAAEHVIDPENSIPVGIFGKNATPAVKAGLSLSGLINGYQKVENDLSQANLDYMADRVGMRSGFNLYYNDSYMVANIADIGKYENKYYEVLEKPISPEGYLFFKEVESGFYTQQLDDNEKLVLENTITENYGEDEMGGYVREYLFGGFDYFDYMENHSYEEYSEMLGCAGVAYTKAFPIRDYPYIETDLNKMAIDWQDNKVKELYQ